MPEVGDEVTVRNWTGEWMQVRVQKLGESKAYGPTIEGIMVEDGIGHRFVSLPLSHLVEMAQAKNISHGKWDLTLPDGEVMRVKSRRAAQEYCTDHDFYFQEV